MKAEDRATEPADEGGDAACWMHEFEAELLGDDPDPSDEDERDT